MNFREDTTTTLQPSSNHTTFPILPHANLDYN